MPAIIQQGRTWKKLKKDYIKKIEELLFAYGGKLKKTEKTPYELWRIEIFGTLFICYSNGTLYSNPPDFRNISKIKRIWKKIDKITNSGFSKPTKDILIGLDETGKGEVIGSVIIAGVKFPKNMFTKIEDIVSTANTKIRHKYEYWEKIFKVVKNFFKDGLVISYLEILPSKTEKYGMNFLLDIHYAKLIEKILKGENLKSCRIVIDNYGIGSKLKKFLKDIERKGAEVIVETNSEEKYIETRLASVIAKYQREKFLKEIKENPKYNFKDIGSGNPGDPATIFWLKKWWKTHKKWPWFVKKNYRTIKEIENSSL